MTKPTVEELLEDCNYILDRKAYPTEHEKRLATALRERLVGEQQLADATMRVEHNYLCIRNEREWLLYDMKLDGREENFAEVYKRVVANIQTAPSPEPSDGK